MGPLLVQLHQHLVAIVINECLNTAERNLKIEVDLEVVEVQTRVNNTKLNIYLELYFCSSDRFQAAKVCSRAFTASRKTSRIFFQASRLPEKNTALGYVSKPLCNITRECSAFSKQTIYTTTKVISRKCIHYI